MQSKDKKVIKIITDNPALIWGFMAAIEYFCDSDITEVLEVADDYKSLLLGSTELDTSIAVWELDAHGLNPLD